MFQINKMFKDVKHQRTELTNKFNATDSVQYNRKTEIKINNMKNTASIVLFQEISNEKRARQPTILMCADNLHSVFRVYNVV